MTVTIIKQLSLQPKDTFETLRHRFVKSETIDFDTTSELVYFARREDVTLLGSTSFVATSYHQPFVRMADASVSHQRNYTYLDYSVRSTDLSRGIWADVEDANDAQLAQMYPFDTERDAQMDGVLREHLGRQREVNRYFEPQVRAAEKKIIAQWLNGHSESKRPLIHRASLHLPVIDYLDALGVIGDMQVMSARQARRTTSNRIFGSYAPIARPTLGRGTFDIERTASLDLRSGDVIQAYLGDFRIDSTEHLIGVDDRQCLVLRGRYLLDDEPEILIDVRGLDEPSMGHRVLTRAA